MNQRQEILKKMARVPYRRQKYRTLDNKIEKNNKKQLTKT